MPKKNLNDSNDLAVNLDLTLSAITDIYVVDKQKFKQEHGFLESANPDNLQSAPEPYFGLTGREHSQKMAGKPTRSVTWPTWACLLVPLRMGYTRQHWSGR